MSDTVGVQKNCYIHPKKFAWRSDIATASQDSMVPTIESNSIPSVNRCLNTAIMPHFVADPDAPNGRALATETQSAMSHLQYDDAPLDFSKKKTSGTVQPQDQNGPNQNNDSVSTEPKIYHTENISVPDKTPTTPKCNGKSSPVPINGRSGSSPPQSPVNGLRPAIHNSETRLQDSHVHSENGRGMFFVPFNQIKTENGYGNPTYSPEQLYMYKSFMEKSQQLKFSTENGRETNGVHLQGDPPSSPTRSSSLSRESSPPSKSSGSILEEVLTGRQVERSQAQGVYTFTQNYSPHESNIKPHQVPVSIPNCNVGLNTQLPRNSTDANATFPRENTALGFPTAVSPLGLPDVSNTIPGISPIIPVASPLISPAGFPVHNPLMQSPLNGINPFLIPQFNPRLPQTSSGDRKTGKPLRPFKALAGDLLMGRLPISPALYSGYASTSFTNAFSDPLRSNPVPKKEASKESENGATPPNVENSSNKEAEHLASNSGDSNSCSNDVNGCNTEIAEASNSTNANRKRSRLSDDQKDEAYWERRRKNNEAAKRSRDARRMKEDMITHTAYSLRQENMALIMALQQLREENAKIKCEFNSISDDKKKMNSEIELLKRQLASKGCWKCGFMYSESFDKKVPLE